MATFGGNDEQRRAERIKELMELVDAKFPPPDQRARKIFALLRDNFPELTNWDLLCFAAEFTAFSVEAFPWLKDVSRDLNRLIYSAHYVMSENHDLSSGVRQQDKSQHNDAEPNSGEKRA